MNHCPVRMKSPVLMTPKRDESTDPKLSTTCIRLRNETQHRLVVAIFTLRPAFLGGFRLSRRCLLLLGINIYMSLIVRLSLLIHGL